MSNIESTGNDTGYGTEGFQYYLDQRTNNDPNNPVTIEDIANGFDLNGWLRFRNSAIYTTALEPLYKTQPDFAKVALQAFRENWTSDRLATEIKQTEGWWPIVERGVRSATGGASSGQRRAAAYAAIKNEAARLGYSSLSEESMQSLANTVVSDNWSADQLTEYLVNGATTNWDTLSGGSLKAAYDGVKVMASRQLISISDDTARSWAKRIASGELDSDGVTNMLQEQAAARFGWAASVISKGISMQDFLAPSRDRIAKELEIEANQLDMTDPKVMSMMTVTDDKGVTRVATDSELLRNARADSRWSSTNGARNVAASAAVMLRDYVEGR